MYRMDNVYAHAVVILCFLVSAFPALFFYSFCFVPAMLMLRSLLLYALLLHCCWRKGGRKEARKEHRKGARNKVASTEERYQQNKRERERERAEAIICGTHAQLSSSLSGLHAFEGANPLLSHEICALYRVPVCQHFNSCPPQDAWWIFVPDRTCHDKSALDH